MPLTRENLLLLSKAFDTVDYSTLLRKLHTLNISKTTLKLFLSYLTDWIQYVQVYQNFAARRRISFGVPQGLILGPIYIQCRLNVDVLNVKHVAQFADDSKPYGLENLIFTPDKTKFMVFTLKHLVKQNQLQIPSRFWVAKSSVKQLLFFN